MRRLQHGMLATMALLTLAATAMAQAQPQAPPLISPEVHGDGRITFRLKAPNAQQVLVSQPGVCGSGGRKASEALRPRWR